MTFKTGLCITLHYVQNSQWTIRMKKHFLCYFSGKLTNESACSSFVKCQVKPLKFFASLSAESKRQQECALFTQREERNTQYSEGETCKEIPASTYPKSVVEFLQFSFLKSNICLI